jgi:tRNA A37 threonylcarbamoyladenosine dehydratase
MPENFSESDGPGRPHHRSGVTRNSGPANAPFPERFARTVDLYGAGGFRRIRSAQVAVFGLGGVGSHAALALARSGIGTLLLVDFDCITASSLNRNPVAGPADVGRPKVEFLAAHLALTCPDTTVTTRQVFFHDDTAAELLTPAPDLVIDAIDSLNPKVLLLAHCSRRELPVISSMGASSRSDVTRVRTGDLATTRICPLAKKVRQRLRRLGIAGGITCVYSEETPVPSLPPAREDLTVDRGRVRNRLPSQISLPGIFGYALASLALGRIVCE